MMEPTRYPGACGLPSNAEEDSTNDEVENDDDPYASSEKSTLRIELDAINADSFSAPTSPVTMHRRRQLRRNSKIGVVLGLSNSGLRRETLRVKKNMATRLLTENDSYVDYVEETVQRARAGSNDPPVQSLTLTSADIPLDVILSDSMHRKTFKMHAESNFCAEPLLFWERVNEYNQLAANLAQNDIQRMALAQNIWKNFLDPSSDTQLMVREALLSPVSLAIAEQRCTPDLFNSIQKEAYSTMQFSLYPDYLSYLNQARSAKTKSSKEADAVHPAEDALAELTTNRMRRSNSISISSDLEVPTLRECLCRPDYAGIFKEFAATLLCEENIEFWRLVAGYQPLRDPEEMMTSARHIWDEFLSPASSTELNVGSKTRKAIRYDIENDLCSSSTFNDAQREIYKLISLDVYPRFCQEYEVLFKNPKK